MKIKTSSRSIFIIAIALLIVAISGVAVFLLATNVQESISLPEGNRYDFGAVSLSRKMEHNFTLINSSRKAVELNASTTNCCSVTTVNPLKMKLEPNEKATVKVSTSAVGSGLRSEGIEIFTSSAGKSESLWLFINYIVK